VKRSSGKQKHFWYDNTTLTASELSHEHERRYMTRHLTVFWKLILLQEKYA